MQDALTPTEVSRLYERYGFLLLRRCRTILRDSSAAEDALQQVFEKLLRNGAGIRDADQPLRWLYRVADRCCFDLLRRRRRSPESPMDVEAATSPAHPAIDVEARNAVMALLATLDVDEQRMAVLLFVDGMSQGEIAAELGVSRVTVNKRVQALRARARGHVEGV
ncbi:MAG TPA: sigma-70 family RNA polymerase sigma factor [Polyangiaceae bacterium]